ncbi:hypothetical protein AJ79_08095 [Helicocarpus griseus UAMH5409]|uniref:MARVEL domain-containing protein n=1 Tax=Helicocarpus griseus UAMH5409 TaxID=1447875 RepID=A0A2B7WW89_9EURO|nr:hypothetical protein AJ79_08095 [Helicocarpus griseus UAMH5409]
MTNSNSSGEHADQYEPVSPIDITTRPRSGVFASQDDDFIEKQDYPSAPEAKPSRTARFAEATSVVSPVDDAPGRSPFADPPAMSQTNHNVQVSDLGFGYMAENQPGREPEQPQAARLNPPNSPLKSALKSPGAGGRSVLMSPTFREEQILEHHEKSTEKANAKDVRIKARVRIAKVFLRGVSFSCSLIILALVGASFMIFNSTKHLAQRNTFSPWAPNTPLWPQIVILVFASISVLLALGVFWAYFRHGHKRAEKVAVYYTVFSVILFVFTLIMWLVGSVVLQNSKQSLDNKDMWGWACAQGTRRELYKDEVNYELVCRMQDWALVCCVIEVVIEVLIIGIYAVVFYRFYSKRKLRKSMAMRDQARNDLYLAHLRSQTAPNTPGFAHGPMSPMSLKQGGDPFSKAEEGYATQYATPRSPESTHSNSQKPFQLRPPPIRVQDATPKLQQQENFQTPMSPATIERMNHHVDAAPGEQRYESVPIPNAYSTPITSPTFAPETRGSDVVPGMAVTSTDRIVHSRNS